jgi:hypothetical protein
MAKKHTLDALKVLFEKQRVLDINQIYKAINTSSRATAFRYLQDLKHLTSYTHSGKYYTLPEIAQFDDDGFWHYGDIGFSSQGTLINTLAHVISISESGKTNSELEKHFRLRVQESLRTLQVSKKIERRKIESRHLYVNSNPDIGDCQIKKRMKVGSRKPLPAWIVAEVLLESIRSLAALPQVETVMKQLSKRGSTITKEQVEQVFEEMGLEKKTLD